MSSLSGNLLNFGLGIALVVSSVGRIAAQEDSSVVAEVGGVKVTMADLEREESAKLHIRRI